MRNFNLSLVNLSLWIASSCVEKNPTLNARSWRPNSFKASFLFAQNSSLTSLHENDIHDRRHAAYYIQRNYVWRWVGRAPADWIMNKILLAFILRLSFSILPSQVQQRAILYELNVFFSQTHSPTWALEKGWIMLCEFSFFASPRRLVVCSILRSTVHNERANCTLSPQFFFSPPTTFAASECGWAFALYHQNRGPRANGAFQRAVSQRRLAAADDGLKAAQITYGGCLLAL